MTDQEKNEVLVRWLGWEQRPHIEDGGCGCDYCTTLHWYTPDGQNPALPDLLHSLDAQAKWLWPKLDYLKLEYEQGVWRAWVRWHSGEADNPAEACAEAILSLIGGDDE